MPGGLLDPAPRRLGRDPALAQGRGGQAALVAQERQQQVLGPDPVMAEPASLPACVQGGLLGAPGDPHRPTSSGRVPTG
jgi:hypothetical protein